MLKSLITLLFTFILAHNLFAENISDVKLQIQEKQIEKLEKKIDDVEDKFNQNNIDKKEMDGKLERNKAVVDNLNSFLTIYGVLITILLALASIVTYKISLKNAREEASAEAQAGLKNWIDKKADNEFKQKVEAYLKQIDEKANQLFVKIEQNHNDKLNDMMANFSLDQKANDLEKIELKKEVDKIQTKDIKDYTYNDWANIFILKYLNKEYKEALEVLDNLLILTNNDSLRVSGVFLARGIIFTLLNKKEEAINIYNKLIKRFKDTKDTKISKNLGDALINKMALNISLNKNNSEENDFLLLTNLAEENIELLMAYKMLKILENSKTRKQDIETAQWKVEFKNVKLNDWNFDILKDWADKLDTVPKERILGYIQIFEKHNAIIK